MPSRGEYSSFLKLTWHIQIFCKQSWNTTKYVVWYLFLIFFTFVINLFVGRFGPWNCNKYLCNIYNFVILFFGIFIGENNDNFGVELNWCVFHGIQKRVIKDKHNEKLEEDRIRISQIKGSRTEQRLSRLFHFFNIV